MSKMSLENIYNSFIPQWTRQTSKDKY